MVYKKRPKPRRNALVINYIIPGIYMVSFFHAAGLRSPTPVWQIHFAAEIGQTDIPSECLALGFPIRALAVLKSIWSNLTGAPYFASPGQASLVKHDACATVAFAELVLVILSENCNNTSRTGAPTTKAQDTP